MGWVRGHIRNGHYVGSYYRGGGGGYRGGGRSYSSGDGSGDGGEGFIALVLLLGYLGYGCVWVILRLTASVVVIARRAAYGGRWAASRTSEGVQWAEPRVRAVTPTQWVYAGAGLTVLTLAGLFVLAMTGRRSATAVAFAEPMAPSPTKTVATYMPLPATQRDAYFPPPEEFHPPARHAVPVEPEVDWHQGAEGWGKRYAFPDGFEKWGENRRGKPPTADYRTTLKPPPPPTVTLTPLVLQPIPLAKDITTLGYWLTARRGQNETAMRQMTDSGDVVLARVPVEVVVLQRLGSSVLVRVDGGPHDGRDFAVPSIEVPVK